MSNRDIGLTGADPWSLLQLLDLGSDVPTVPGRSLHQLLAACISPSAFAAYVESRGGSAVLASMLFEMTERSETGGLPLDETLARLDPAAAHTNVMAAGPAGEAFGEVDLAMSLKELRAALAAHPGGSRAG